MSDWWVPTDEELEDHYRRADAAMLRDAEARVDSSDAYIASLHGVIDAERSRAERAESKLAELLARLDPDDPAAVVSSPSETDR